MTGMSDREKAFENKFAHDEEMKFKAVARRNKLLGLWVAGQIGKADAEAYAKEVVAADFQEAGDDDVIRKVKGDFDAANVAMTEEQIVQKMTELHAEAKRQLFEE
ncbi:DUF1476 domain-containing protein [Gellertiella hungarica]|uniref:DUF1476 domain-containing protein n=1 Tax=Gellertiella hungarica TaxID=1572859 RepID=A0A7W6J4K2_9HYPH|nr:DUF1476 domain-containing protein [Gellertiella hungarica]MBB4064647.1 hypothetical protein [Gellertiella hungarica]